MKVFALTDIHGRCPNINMFINAGFNPSNLDHHIVFLGDYFDRYHENLEVLEFLENLQNTYPNRIHLIKGNHDAFLENFINQALECKEGSLTFDEKLLDLWHRNGGDITIKQLFGDILDQPVLEVMTLKQLHRVKHFLDSLLPYYETNNNLFTHAFIDETYHTDYWERKTVISDNKTNKNIYIGHTTFFDAMEMYPFLKLKKDGFNCGNVLYNDQLNNNVYLIDNGMGNNIVVIED